MLIVKPTLLCSAQIQQPVANCAHAQKLSQGPPIYISILAGAKIEVPIGLPFGVLASLRPPMLGPAACTPHAEGLACSTGCLSPCPLSPICPSATCLLLSSPMELARFLSAVRMCDLGMASMLGEGLHKTGVRVGSGWGLRGSSMSSCLLVWLAGILDLDLAPVGGVLASNAPPSKAMTYLRSWHQAR